MSKIKENWKLILAVILGLLLVIFMVKPRPSTMDVARDEVAPHVISINENWGGVATRIGTGFYVRHAGKTFLITVKHICIDYQDRMLETSEGKSKIIKMSTDGDLCALETHRKSGLYIAKSKPEKFDETIVVGHPRGDELQVQLGHYIDIVTKSLHLSKSFNDLYKTNLPSIAFTNRIWGGNSGSPLTNASGELLGVVNIGSENISTQLGVPLSQLIPFLESL